MDWGTLVFGLVLGSCVTSALVWGMRSRAQAAVPEGYFARVALSVALTALVAGMARTLLDYSGAGQWSMTGTLFGTGWLIGGLVAAWLVSRPMRRT